MKLPRTMRILAPALSLALTACLDPLSQLAGGGIGGTGISVVGVVTGFGSVFVSGVEYQTSNATTYDVDSNGTASQSDLKIGMVVNLNGAFAADGTPQAQKIVYRPSVKGPVVCNPDGSLTVLQQTVKTDGNPTYDGFNCQTGNGKVIDVSGLHDANGVIHATRVGLVSNATAGQVYEAHGQVSNLVNTGGTQTFTLGQLSVNFAGVTPVPTKLVNGARVEVKGTLGSTPTTLNATGISFEDGESKPRNTRASIEGLITTISSSTTFQVGNQQVGNQQVVTNQNTTITDVNNNVLSANQLAVGWRIEVSGTFDADGNVVATRVHQER